MTINDEILTIANQIANSGNKPTVALIKARLKKSVPLPILISTLKGWQHEPSFIALPQTNEELANESNTDVSEAGSLRELLNEELGQMKQEIAELKKLIHELVAQQKKPS
ncbi:MAG: hypothetical protein OQK09_11045 [Colwellia sp.]|nr:hypothetical protein [Colwellia sp.]MCW8866193.1 hypothetical protein [Colwellia sp.]MCW9082037.1 hypothetical protein [Colwellia sp.]